MSLPTNSDPKLHTQLDSVTVRTGSRLHFGLFSFGRTQGRQYGGVGLMVTEPKLSLRITPSAQFHVAGPLAERVSGIVQHWQRQFGQERLPACKLEVVDLPAQHIGLGSGTQLGCAVAAGLSAWQGQPIASAQQLALASGRAARSAIGTHGFLQGGLIFDDGKPEGQPLGTLMARLAFPTEWRVLLISPQHATADQKVSGSREQSAFQQMPAVSQQQEAQLRRLACDQLRPAVEVHDFIGFSQALYQYNQLAGECYRSLQGGTYASSQVAKLIERLRELGIEGVGQSSWGPLVFAMVSSQERAEELRQQLESRSEFTGFRCQITSALNEKATIDVG